jgi:Transposase DDE domain
LKLCGAGEWLVEKHGTKTRRSWRKLHFGMDVNTGEVVATALTTNDVDDAFQVGPLLAQVAGPGASFTGDGAYDQDSVYRAVIDRGCDGRNRHGDEVALVIRQSHGTLAKLPVWMTGERAIIER